MIPKTRIDDFLSPYENDPKALTAIMSKWASESSANWLISELSRRCDGGESSTQITAEGIRMLAFALGFEHIEKFGALTDILSNCKPEKLLDWLGMNQMPVQAMIEYGNAPTINATNILASVKKHMTTSDDVVGAEWEIKFDPRFDDEIYKPITLAAFKDVLARCPLPHRGYEAQNADCDDYARCVRGYLSRWGIGNYGVGAAGIVFLDVEDKILANHVVILADLIDGSTVMAEPQTRSIVPPTYNRGGLEVRNAIIETRF